MGPGPVAGQHWTAAERVGCWGGWSPGCSHSSSSILTQDRQWVKTSSGRTMTSLSHSDRWIIRKESAAITTWTAFLTHASRFLRGETPRSMERSRLWAAACVRNRISKVTVQAPGLVAGADAARESWWGAGACWQQGTGHSSIHHRSFTSRRPVRHMFMTLVNASERLTPMVGTSYKSTGSGLQARRVWSHSSQRANAPPRAIPTTSEIGAGAWGQCGRPFRTHQRILQTG